MTARRHVYTHIHTYILKPAPVTCVASLQIGQYTHKHVQYNLFSRLVQGPHTRLPHPTACHYCVAKPLQLVQDDSR